MGGVPGRTTYAWRQIVKHLKETATHCAKCGGEFNPDLRWPHPYSLSGGHILPLVNHPELADDPTNAQAEHLRCNTKDGDRIARSRWATPQRYSWRNDNY